MPERTTPLLDAREDFYPRQSAIQDDSARIAADLGMILDHMQSGTAAIRARLRFLAGGLDEDHQTESVGRGRSCSLEEIYSLCALLDALREEARRKIKRLSTWVMQEMLAEDAKATNTRKEGHDKPAAVA